MHLQKMVAVQAKPTLGATWREHDRVLRQMRRQEREIKRREREWARLTPKERAQRKAWAKTLARLAKEEQKAKAKEAAEAAA